MTECSVPFTARPVSEWSLEEVRTYSALLAYAMGPDYDVSRWQPDLLVTVRELLRRGAQAALRVDELEAQVEALGERVKAYDSALLTWPTTLTGQ